MSDGKVTITVDLDGTSAQQGVKQLKSLLQGLGESSSSGFNIGTKSALGFGTAMAVASAVVQKGMTMVSSSVGGAISRFDTMQKFPKMMSALGYSTDDAKKSINTLRDGIQGLPTALDEVVATTQSLAMMNGDLGKSTKLTLALNNAFLASGMSAGDASRGLTQFSQMMSSGKVDMQSWKTLMETMPLGLQRTAEAFGYIGASAKNDLYAALKEGHITFDQFSDKLIELNDGVDGFAALAKINSIGIATSMENVKTAVRNGLSSLIASFDEASRNKGLGRAFGEVVKWVAEAVTKAAEFISSLPPGTIQAIASAVLGAVAAFKGIKTAVSAVNSLKTAFGLLKAALTGNPFMLAAVALGALVGWFIHAYTTSETFRAKVDEVVAVVSKVAGKIKEFLSGVDPSLIAMLVPALGLLLAKFKGFETISKFNPFSIFKKNAKDAFDGASGSASQSKGIIEQVFSGLGTLITSIAQGISTVLQGLATALSTVAQGFGTAAAMASPAQWLSMGAAMLMVGAGVALASAGIYVLVQAAIQLASAGSGAAIALVGLGVGIAAMAGVFALLGPALTASAVGMVAFGAAVALIGAGIGMASAGLAMLASQLPTIATYGSSAASAILALSGAIVAFGAGVAVAGAGLLVLSAGLIAFGAASLVAAAGGVALAAGIVVVSAAVAAFGLALQPVASAVKKMGQGAKDAGTGTKQLASGLKSITSLPLGSLVTHLGAVAIGIGKISGKGGEIASVGAGMKQLGQGLTTIATSGMLAVTAMTVIGTAITQLSTQMTTLPATLTLAAAGFATFSSQAVAGVAGLSAINAPLTALKTQIMTLAPAFMMASSGLTAFGSQAMVVGASFTMLGAGITIVRTGLVGVSTAFNAMRGQVQSSMNAMLNVVKSVGNQMKSQGSQIGQQTSQNLANGIRSGAGQVSSAMQTLTNVARSAGMSGVGAMQSVGAMIGQGLAQGMLSALGAVTAAANALVAQAERAAQAKAKIHSPSRLFRDGVGRFISQGVAVGISKDAYKVDDAMGDVFNQIQAFSFKAEDIIGVGKSNVSKSIQAKVSATHSVEHKIGEIVGDKVNQALKNLHGMVDHAMTVAEKAVQRPSNLVLDTGVLVGNTVDDFSVANAERIRRQNRMRGIL